jgi:hypothetical protein
MNFEPAKFTVSTEMYDFESDLSTQKLRVTPGFGSGEFEEYDGKIVLTDNLSQAFMEEKLFLSIDKEQQIDSLPLYLSVRNILSRNLSDGTELYVDYIQYNDKDVLPTPVLNRSLGHANDVQELEIFQVLSGEILSIFFDPSDPDRRYIGNFSEMECYAVPPGWFHCTYIISGPSVVVNFYCHAFWGVNIEEKPYFKLHNPVSVELREGKIVILEKRESEVEAVGNYAKGKFSAISPRWLPYEQLIDSHLYFAEIAESKDIFKLFQSDRIESWLKA